MSGWPDSAAAPSFTGERRLAMVVATQTYADPSLRQLRAPARDVEDLRELLADQEVGGFEVTAVIDRPAHEIRLAIEDFLVDRRTDDLLLIYLTCHGLVDVRRRSVLRGRRHAEGSTRRYRCRGAVVVATARRLPRSAPGSDLGLLL